MTASPFAIIGVIFATMLGAIGSLFFKFGSRDIALSFRGIFQNLNLALGLFFYGISSIIFIISLKYGELSILYGFVGFQYVWISLLSIKYLRERMNAMKWLGIALIVAGSLAMNF